MIADDEMYMLQALEKLIDWERLSCQLVYKASNGEELIEQIKNEVPDIVITDIKMPVINGLEVAKYIYDQMLPTKVIILSAYADFEYAQEAIQYDVCGYIVKTSAIEKLPGMLNKAISKLSGPVAMEKEEKYSEDIFGKLQKYITAHYMDKLTLTTIAEEIHANGSYLSRMYKVKTGQNLFDAINKMKLEKAKEYLAEGKRVSEIAALVGFDDVSYFSRVFKKYENCSPRDYEKK
jgi:YesN/AraC family two-component response regulator